MGGRQPTSSAWVDERTGGPSGFPSTGCSTEKGPPRGTNWFLTRLGSATLSFAFVFQAPDSAVLSLAMYYYTPLADPGPTAR